MVSQLSRRRQKEGEAEAVEEGGRSFTNTDCESPKEVQSRHTAVSVSLAG